MSGTLPKTILFVSRLRPDPSGGSAIHTDDVIRFLKTEGFQVHFLCLDPRGAGDCSRSSADMFYLPEMKGRGVDEFDGQVNDAEKTLVDLVASNVLPGIVIADYSWMGDLFDAPYFQTRPEVRRLIFVHDLRVRIVPSLIRMRLMNPDDNRWNDEREGRLLAKANALIVLNREDRQRALSLAPNAKTVTVGISSAAKQPGCAARIAGRCIYVASNASENAVALSWLLKFVWPLVMAANPRASLSVCGSVGESERLRPEVTGLDAEMLRKLNVTMEGSVDDLAQYYAAAEISLIPHFMDGGIKIKHVEAISYGLPVVCTTAGADGLPEAAGNWALVADGSKQFARQVVLLMNDKTQLESMRQNALTQSARMTREHAYRELKDYLSGQSLESVTFRNLTAALPGS